MILLIVGCGIAADPQIPKARTNPAPKVTCDATRYGARLVPDSGIWFGVNLDWARDSPVAYGARLGRLPAVVTEFAAAGVGAFCRRYALLPINACPAAH